MNRRPLNSRNAPWARHLAERLVQAGIAPDTISQASIGAAALGFLMFWAAPSGGLVAALCLLLAAAACQVRLLCNLLDGMVAVEGGQGGRAGPFWNEAPDRLADALLLGGAGLAAGSPALGLMAACLALGTAYLRELGRAEGQPPDFGGPMAKPHRMAALTAGSVIAALWPFAPTNAVILEITLWIIIAGTALTILLRARRLLQAMNAR